MKVYLRWVNNKFVPSDVDQHKKLSKLKEGAEVECDIKQPRNLKFLKKYFAMLNTVYEQQEVYTNREWFRKIVQIKAGHCDTFLDEDGQVFHEVKTISFKGCSEEDFTNVYNHVLDICINNYLPAGHNEDTINSMVEERLRFVG